MKLIKQYDQMDCGPACLAMIASHYGKKISLQYLRDKCYLTKDGVSLLGMNSAAEHIGLNPVAGKINEHELTNDLCPAIIHWNQNHFVVIKKITKNSWTKKKFYHIADPSHGFVKLNSDKFLSHWKVEEEEGIALLLEPTDKFENFTPPKDHPLGLKFLLSYLKPYGKQLGLMSFLMLIGSILTLILPFLTQKLIDQGVMAKDMSYVRLMVYAQIAIVIGSVSIQIFRNWIMLFVGTKISINIISEFLKKMLALPIKFFDTKLIGDFNQRIQDNERIEKFLTSNSLTTFFSVITFSVFFGVLWYYDFSILLIYLGLTIISVSWSYFWLHKRKILDFIKFRLRSENQESIYEMLYGVSEMKMNKFESFKRKEWEDIQDKLYKINIKILKIDQLQVTGFELLNQLKNIVVTLLAASFVIDGSITIGALLSISFIIGQMNAPVSQLINFFRSLQDARLSLRRLNEIEFQQSEETGNMKVFDPKKATSGKGFQLSNVVFQYKGPDSVKVLDELNLSIQKGQVTAIVGESGSGKTTLMKLLLKLYDPVNGSITLDDQTLSHFSPTSLREHCGIVMQDGYIFSDTILRNIVMGDEKVDYPKLAKALKIANIVDYVNSLPSGFNTRIGASGNGLSGGQRQRILIARAVYKDPEFIFFDEATSALDADNEKIIHDNLQQFFQGKTVVIIAHRLSTVKNADHIIVMKDGKITEQGKHLELVDNKSNYFNLVKNQLELGA